MANISVTTDQNYTALGHADNDRITISQGATVTINTDTNRLEDLICTTFGRFLVTNSSATTPIFVDIGDDTTNSTIQIEAGGVLEIKGAWIVVGTSDGTAGQTFTLPTNAAGDKIPSMGGVHVFPSGEEKPVMFATVDSFTDTFGDELFGTVFTHDFASNTITFGDGFNGYVPPIGAEIRIPNIWFVDTCTSTYYTDFDLSTSGKLDFDIAAFTDNFAFNFVSASATSIKNTTFGTGRELVNIGSQQNPYLENCVFTIQANTSGAIQSSAGNDVEFKNVLIYNTNATTGYHGFYITNGSLKLLEDCRVIAPNQGTSTSRCCFFFTSPNGVVRNCFGASSGVTFNFAAGSGNALLENIGGNAAGKRNPTAFSVYLVRGVNCGNLTFLGVSTKPDTVAEGLVSYNTYTISASTGTSNWTIDGGVFYCGETGDTSRTNSPLDFNGAGHRVNGIHISGTSSGDTINHGTASARVQVSNLTFLNPDDSASDMEWCDGAFYDLVASPDRLDTTPANNGIDVSSLHLRVSNSLTDGYLFKPMGQDVNNGLLTEVTVSGAYFFDNAGRLYMTTSGDVLDFETAVHGGIADFSGAVVSGTTTGNFSYQFALRNPNGVYGAFQTLSTGNLQSAIAALAGYDSDVGLQVKFRITRTASNSTDNIQNIRLDTVLDPAYVAPFEVFPTELEFLGLQAGDSIYVEDAAGAQKLFTTATGATYSMVLPNANDGESWTYVVKRAGYNHQRGVIAIESGVDVNINVSLSEKQQAIGGSMYNASDVASVSVDFDLATPQMSIDVSQPQTSPQNVFDKVERALVTNDGMKWLAQQGVDTSYQNLGGAGSFLFHQSNIRVRRRSPSDDNAEVLAFVFSTDGIAVDESNGGVAVFSGTLVRDVWEAVIDDYDDEVNSFGQAIATMLSSVVSNLDTPVSTRLAAAAYTAPNNTGITSILTHTSELQANQGDWLTATGFSTHTQGDVVTAMQSVSNEFKADVSGLSTQASIDVIDANLDAVKAKTDTLINTDLSGISADIAALNDFNPATDTVAHVTLVDTVTVNTDMRGTEGANTIAPDNAAIAEILTDTADLQANQGDWLTVDKTDLALEQTAQDIKANTGLIPAIV